jgi:uncharacterized cupin superfamily protein
MVTVVQAGAVELGPDPIDPELIVSGDPAASAADIAQGKSGAVTGVWKIEPGVVTDTEVEETFVVLEGRATIECDGESYDLGPGSVCVFEAGAETTWTVHETLLKVYLIPS